MKAFIHLSIFALLLMAGNSGLMAQKKSKVTTAEFKVHGVCNMCKTRIENAALIKGVKFAKWDKENQSLKVIFRHDKVTEDAIHQSLADAGHDTDKVKASDEVYKKIPDCCAYRDGVHTH